MLYSCTHTETVNVNQRLKDAYVFEVPACVLGFLRSTNGLVLTYLLHTVLWQAGRCHNALQHAQSIAYRLSQSGLYSC